MNDFLNDQAPPPVFGRVHQWNKDTEEKSRRLRFRALGRPRKILITNPAKPYFQDRFADVLREEGLEDHVEYSVMIGSHLNTRDDYPDRINMDEYRVMDRYDAVMRNHSKNLPPAIGAFFDYEPAYRDFLGIERSWSNRTRYTAADVEFFRKVFEELRQVGIPLSNYGVPRVPRAKRMSFLRMRALATAWPIVDQTDNVQLNMYPIKGKEMEYSVEDEIKHRSAISQHIEVFAKSFPLHPIIPFLFARPSGVDNFRYFSIYVDAISNVDFIDTIQYWTNTHTDYMASLFIDQLRTVAPVLRAWVNFEMIPA